jgi:hypothetical protein
MIGHLAIIAAVLAASINACFLGCLVRDAISVTTERRRIF